MLFYKMHLFFCTNYRENGKKCCQHANASELCNFAKNWVREQGMSGGGGIRVSSSGCMGRCAEGPVLVVYPQGVWYTYLSQDDIEEILRKHVKGGQIVERLLLPQAIPTVL
jgi:(2Fe-2S) ferredoxin